MPSTPGTPRTLATLYSQFATNGAGQISASDLRDLVASMRPALGVMGLSESQLIDISGQDAFVELTSADMRLGTNTYDAAAASDVKGFDLVAEGRLSYNEAVASRVLVQGDVVLSHAEGSGQTVRVQLRKNGSDTTVLCEREVVVPNGGEASVSLHGITRLGNAQYLSLWVANSSSANDVTAAEFTLTALATFGSDG